MSVASAPPSPPGNMLTAPANIENARSKSPARGKRVGDRLGQREEAQHCANHAASPSASPPAKGAAVRQRRVWERMSVTRTSTPAGRQPGSPNATKQKSGYEQNGERHDRRCGARQQQNPPPWKERQPQAGQQRMAMKTRCAPQEIRDDMVDGKSVRFQPDCPCSSPAFPGVVVNANPPT